MRLFEHVVEDKIIKNNIVHIYRWYRRSIMRLRIVKRSVMGHTQFFNCALLHSITGGKEVLVCNVCNDKSIMMSTLRGVKSTSTCSRCGYGVFDVSDG